MPARPRADRARRPRPADPRRDRRPPARGRRDERSRAAAARSPRACAGATAHPELFEVFPFEHDLLYEARLADGRLEYRVTVRRVREPIPCRSRSASTPTSSPPGAAARGLARRAAGDAPPCARPRADPVGARRGAPGRSASQLGEREFDDGFDSVAGRRAVRRRRRAAGGIEIELLEGYPCAQVFAPLGGRFICFEPMTAPANALRSGDGLRLLAPGETARGRVRPERRGPAERPGDTLNRGADFRLLGGRRRHYDRPARSSVGAHAPGGAVSSTVIDAGHAS